VSCAAGTAHRHSAPATVNARRGVVMRASERASRANSTAPTSSALPHRQPINCSSLSRGAAPRANSRENRNGNTIDAARGERGTWRLLYAASPWVHGARVGEGTERHTSRPPHESEGVRPPSPARTAKTRSSRTARDAKSHAQGCCRSNRDEPQRRRDSRRTVYTVSRHSAVCRGLRGCGTFGRSCVQA
jgi:hypothetical protein